MENEKSLFTEDENVGRASITSAPRLGLGRQSTRGLLPDIGVLEEQELDAVGKLYMNLLIRARKFFGMAAPKTKEEMQLRQMADMIHTYRGIAEDDVEKEEPIWVDRAPVHIFMIIVTILNTIIIGLEVDYADIVKREWHWVLFETVFCFIFSGEVVFKTYYHGYRWAFRGIWNFIAVVIAITVTVELMVYFVIGLEGEVRIISLLRVFGLVRLGKIIKKSDIFPEIRLVAQGLSESFQTLMWTFVLLTVFIYICAVLLTKQIGHNVETYGSYKKLSGGWDHEDHFGTVPRSMYTLMQVATLDSWLSQVARHTITNQWYMIAFWTVFLLVSTFGIMNIVVSIIVELMIAASANDEKRQMARENRKLRVELESLREVFTSGDTSGDNSLDIHEFETACQNQVVQMRMRQLGLPLNDAAALFSAIDTDSSRTLTFNEFVTGCMKLKGISQSKELLAIQAHADSMCQKMDVLGDSLADSERMMGALDEVTTRISKRFDMAVLGSKRKLAQSIRGTLPMKPPPLEKPSGDEVPLSIGNRPVLPQFPDLLK